MAVYNDECFNMWVIMSKYIYTYLNKWSFYKIISLRVLRYTYLN